MLKLNRILISTLFFLLLPVQSTADSKMEIGISVGPDLGPVQRAVGGEVTLLSHNALFGGGMGYAHSYKRNSETVSLFLETNILAFIGIEAGYICEFRHPDSANGYRFGGYLTLFGMILAMNDIVTQKTYIPIPFPYFRYTGFKNSEDNYFEFGLLLKFIFGDIEPPSPF